MKVITFLPKHKCDGCGKPSIVLKNRAYNNWLNLCEKCYWQRHGQRFFELLGINAEKSVGLFLKK